MARGLKAAVAEEPKSGTEGKKKKIRPQKAGIVGKLNEFEQRLRDSLAKSKLA